MAKINTPRGKLVRKFGENIFGNPKFDKLLNRKPYGPGQHAQARRGKVSNYGTQLLSFLKLPQLLKQYGRNNIAIGDTSRTY